MKRSRYVIGNWKMNTTLKQARALLSGVEESDDRQQVGIAPPYPWIVPLFEQRAAKRVWIGAQNAEPIESGAYTGDVSVTMIAPYTDFILLGHSEQRLYHPVDHHRYARAARQATSAGIVPIYCIGENESDRSNGEAHRVVHEQLQAGFYPEFRVEPTPFIIAYEPVWAIGTGNAATASDAEAMADFIDTWISRNLDLPSGTIPILYGGSVSPRNAADFVSQPHVDGLLVGGASLKVKEFNEIIEATRSVPELV